MYFSLLVLGVVLWWAGHLFKRAAPARRAAMGDRGKGPVALILLASIALMVVGYRGSDYVHVYDLGAWTKHLNNLLMVPAIVLLGLGSSKSRFNGALRHPMLTGFLLWSIAHLLPNGDLDSIVLFGGLGLWALVQMVAINRAEPTWKRPAPGTLAGDIRLLAISAVIFAVIAGIHIWLGYNPFGA